jgi:hypothetical protein
MPSSWLFTQWAYNGYFAKSLTGDPSVDSMMIVQMKTTILASKSHRVVIVFLSLYFFKVLDVFKELQTHGSNSVAVSLPKLSLNT